MHLPSVQIAAILLPEYAVETEKGWHGSPPPRLVVDRSVALSAASANHQYRLLPERYLSIIAPTRQYSIRTIAVRCDRSDALLRVLLFKKRKLAYAYRSLALNVALKLCRDRV